MTPSSANLPAELEERLRFETLIAELSSKFVNLPPGEVDQEIEDAQRRVCECLGLDIATLWQWSIADPDVITLTHLYRPLGGPPVPEGMNALEYFPWCLQEVRAGRIIALASLAEAPPEAARDVEVWRHYGIKSNLTISLSAGGGPALGAASFHAVREERAWPEEIVKRLQLVAQVFANALARKRYDQALRESEEQLRTALDAAGMGAWSMDPQSRQVWASGSERMLFGFSHDAHLTYDSFLEVIHPEDREPVRAAVANTLRTEAPLLVEYRIVRPDGHVRWIRARGRLYRGAKAEPGRLMGVSVDITNLNRAEESLREAQTTLTAIIDSTDDLIWSVDPVSFGLITFNRGLRDYFLDGRGIRLEPGMRPEDLFPPGEYVQRWRDFYQRALQEGPFTTEYVVYTQTKTLQLSFRVIKRDGKVFGVSAFGKDITERKRAEMELQEQRHELAHAARVSVMGELAASVAHELGQPLGAILANAEAGEMFLRQEPPALAELGAILTDIREDDERAGEVIQRMRALLRKRELQREPLDLNALVEDVLRLVSADAALRKTAITGELWPYVPPVLGDRIHLQQVLLNLVMNALDAMASQPPSRRRLTVRTSQTSQGEAEVAVSDFGPGIEADKLQRIFEPFFTTKSNGIGMGLAIARKLVEAHHGRLWAENRPAGGAILRFTLPAAAGKGVGKGRQ